MDLDGLFWVRLNVYRNLNKDWLFTPQPPPCPDIEGMYLNHNEMNKQTQITMAQQTAVEWFFDKLKNHEIQAEHFELYEQAKAL